MAFFSKQQQAQSQVQSTQTSNCDDGYNRKVTAYTSKNGQTVQTQFTDEVAAAIEKVLGQARTTYILDLMEKGDEITEEDLQVLTAVLNHIQEEQKEVVEELIEQAGDTVTEAEKETAKEMTDSMICSLTKCYISGCEVHTVYPDMIHYGNCSGTCFCRISKAHPRIRRGIELYKSKAANYVEVYENHYCVVGYGGSTQVINE